MEPLQNFPPDELDRLWRLVDRRGLDSRRLLKVWLRSKQEPREGREIFDSRPPFQICPVPGAWAAFDSAKSQLPRDLERWEGGVRIPRVGWGQAPMLTIDRGANSQADRFWFGLRVPPLSGPTPEQQEWIEAVPRFFLWTRERFESIEVDHDDERKTGSIIESEKHSVRSIGEGWGVIVEFPKLPVDRLVLRLAWTDTIGNGIWGGVSHMTKIIR